MNEHGHRGTPVAKRFRLRTLLVMVAMVAGIL